MPDVPQPSHTVKRVSGSVDDAMSTFPLRLPDDLKVEIWLEFDLS